MSFAGFLFDTCYWNIDSKGWFVASGCRKDYSVRYVRYDRSRLSRSASKRGRSGPVQRCRTLRWTLQRDSGSRRSLRHGRWSQFPDDRSRSKRSEHVLRIHHQRQELGQPPNTRYDPSDFFPFVLLCSHQGRSSNVACALDVSVRMLHGKKEGFPACSPDRGLSYGSHPIFSHSSYFAATKGGALMWLAPSTFQWGCCMGKKRGFPDCSPDRGLSYGSWMTWTLIL